MLSTSLPPSARFVAPQQASTSSSKLVLFDVMDTLVRDPFFCGFERDLFGLSGGIGEVHQAASCPRSTARFEV